ncbi:DUF4493 domain-containing protein [Bacteroides gallinaceum]|uniref:DUF4493 domain-containing protein n=1 Tax=Bacteroides gallinaceum TaxID=1462571 RepID=UPI0025AB290E|nr:DUF4493 domain-containing protein [Bacteroides gallinaceum]MDN0067748.1 DUF4493 domain-containing protein [Bacteroides gallinaceum]
MKQNKNKYVIFLCLSLLLGFSSCEMKDELLGHEEQTEQLGSLEVELFSIYNNVIMSRAEEDVTAEDDGTTTGDFDAVDKDVNQYTLVVTNTETQEVVKKGQVSDLKNGGDKISLPLPVGKYNVKAYNYDCFNISVSTRPYFEGSANFSITNGTPTDVTLSCKLSWIEVKLNPTNAFINAFKDDYTITVDNGDGASQIFNKNNIGTKYYFKTPVNKNSLTVSVKATTQEGNTPIDMVYTIQKPADAEGQSANLAGGDSFLINLTEAKATDSHISAIEISANLTFTTDGTTVEIPFEDIIYNGPGLTPQPPVGEPTITFTGLPATYNCASGDQTIAGLQNVVIYVSENSTGIKSLNVTISGAIESLLGMVSLPSSFDICDLDDGVKNALVGLGLISEDDYAGLHAGTVKKFTFNLSGLLVLVPQVTTGTSTFSLSVNDGVTTDGGDIIVNVN